MSREEAERKRQLAVEDILRTVYNEAGCEMSVKGLLSKFFPEPEYNKDTFSWALISLVDEGSLVMGENGSLQLVAQG